MGHIAIFIISILWITLSFNAMMSYLPMAQNLKGFNIAIFFLVFAIGGPIFGINLILTAILDCILPEGWDNDDFSQGY